MQSVVSLLNILFACYKICVCFRYFERQFEIVEHLNLPMFLHSRNAAEDFAAIIKRHRDKIKGGVVSVFDVYMYLSMLHSHNKRLDHFCICSGSM